MFRWFTDKLDAKRRKLDIKFLFPAVRDQVVTGKATAEAAIYKHMLLDDAWYKYFTNEQLQELARQYANDTN